LGGVIAPFKNAGSFINIINFISLCNIAVWGDSAAVSACIIAGADINTADRQGHTALMLAANCGKTAIVTALLSAPGIRVNQKNEYDGNTALIAAAHN
jgi:ankyrin repeat protein